MKYYKIILDNSFIGAIHSGLFVAEGGARKRLFFSDETRGQYANYNGILYHDYWMQPIDSEREFIQANIIEITKEEYDIFIDAINNNVPVEDEEDEEIVIPTPITPEQAADVIYVKEAKITEMSNACRRTIEGGFDLELRGEEHHFSLDTQDQLNLMSLSVMAQTQTLIPYHADGEECIFFTNEEINEIVDTANAFRIYHTTYYNALKHYINALDTIEAIAAIQYGISIPEEYKSDVLKTLEV